MTTEKILAWHWVAENWKLRDGNTVAAGYVYTSHDDLKMCRSGLHASRCPLDALYYAPGPIVCRVECWGEVQEQKDKLVCRHREVLWVADATRTLHEFGLWCAERVRHLMKDKRSLAALQAKRDWLDGKISDEELATARDAAWDARDAAWAAWNAAWNAGAAAWAAWAAWDAAAARGAARAAWNAAWEAAGAAWNAAGNAAGDAERDAQGRKLTEMLLELEERDD